MERRLRKDSKVLWVLKALLVSYVVTGMLLLILAMLLYKFDLDEKSVSAGIIAIYVASTLIGGLVLGNELTPGGWRELEATDIAKLFGQDALEN